MIKANYFLKKSKYPIFISTNNWYEIIQGPFEMNDKSIIYIARPTGRIFSSKEYVERRYYIRVSRKNEPMEILDEKFMGEQLCWRTIDIFRIADCIHDTGINNVDWLRKYVFSIAKIHNNTDWLYEVPQIELPQINTEEVKLLDMSLSVQVFEYLKQAGINSLKDIISLPQNRLDDICSYNADAITEINEMVKKYDISFVKLP